jgi:ubiquitin C-terminal hydrolase
MSINNQVSEIKDDFIIKHIKMIKELYEAETFLDEKILSTGINKKENFVLFDKDWLTKWKNIVGFEKLKDKCKSCNTDAEKINLINEVRNIFIELDTPQKLKELGDMDTSKLIKDKKKSTINEESNFVPILSHKCAYFSNSIKGKFTINSEISKGVIFIHDLFPDKNKEQKLILLYKEAGKNQDFIRPVITLDPKAKIQNVVKELKNKPINEILNKKEFNIKIVKPIETTGKEEKSKEEEERLKAEADKKKKEEEEKKKKEKEEKERKEKEEKERKEKEEEEKRKKEEEDKKKKDEEVALIKEFEEKRRKEEEKRIKEEEEKKRKELEKENKNQEDSDAEKIKKLEEERIKRQQEEIEKENAKKEKERQERERPVNKKYENQIIQNNLIDAMKKQISFDNNIRSHAEKGDENFLLDCSIINREWYEKFIKLSNFDFVKQSLEKSPNQLDNIVQNAIKDKTINLDELNKLIEQKPKPIDAKALEDIENLAFVDDEFLNKILNFGVDKNKSANVNVNSSNNNNIINNQIPLQQNQPKAKIMVNKQDAIFHINNQKYVCANIQDSNLNKRKNVMPIPIQPNQDIMAQIGKNSQKKGLINEVKDQYMSDNIIGKPRPIQPQMSPIMPPQPVAPHFIQPQPIIPQPIPPQPIKQEPAKLRITIDNKDSSLGLDNVGATCYMNATLQCLAHIKRITEHIINYREDKKLKDTKKFKLSEAYSEVVYEIWLPKDPKKKSFAPNRFKKVLGEMNSLFAPTAANDAKDLLIYFIEQMHTELNQSKETNLNLVMPDNMNPMDHQDVLRCFAEEFMKKYNSVFSHYCYGSNVSVTHCNGCNVQKFSYQCFSFIIFPLLEAKKHCVISGRLNPLNYNNYILNIEDCFLYNQKLEFFTGNNQMYCNICQASKDSSMQTRISTAPLILILILNRGKGNLDFKEPFIFWEIIDLRNYVEFPQPDNFYFLSGVVSHMGDSGPSGHFIAFCRMSPNSKWYCYNDSIVSESNFNEINTRGTPYILFYQKSEMVA